MDGLIWMFHGAKGAEAGWPVPRVAEYGDDAWTPFSAAGNRWVVRTQPQVIQENACDIQHLRELHRFPSPAVVDITADGLTLTSSFTHERSYEEAGVDDRVMVSTTIEIHGMGLSKQVSIADGGICSTSLCTTTPIDEDRLELRMASAIRRLDDHDTTVAVHEVVLATTAETIKEDIPLWETRDYATANWHQGDRGIATYQRWAKQFYL